MSMYFDHARCPTCGASFDPDKLAVRDGHPACPHCGGQMKLVDMFGIADAFAEDDEPELTLEDAIPEWDGQSPRPQQQAPSTEAPRRDARGGARTHIPVSTQDVRPSSDNLPAPTKGGGRGPQSAMDAMRQLKNKK